MGLKIFSQLVFMAFMLLLGQLSIGGQTIGHRFLVQVKQGCFWAVESIRKTRLFADVSDIKAVDSGVEKAKAMEANVAGKVEHVGGLSKEIEEKLEKMKNEALRRVKKTERGIEQFENGEDDDENSPESKLTPHQPSVSAVDQDAFLKNLP